MFEKKDKISIKETFEIVGKALTVSLKIKTPFSIFANIIGFITAFLPLLIAQFLEKLTNSLFHLQTANYESVSKTMTIFAVIGGLYIAQAINTFLQNYVAIYDTMRIQEYIKETIIKITCRVDYKYIQNYDDFREKINLFESATGKQVAKSMNVIIQWLQNLLSFIMILSTLISVNIWIVIVLVATCIPSILLCYNQKDDEYRFKTKWMKEGAMVIHYYGMCCAPDSMNELRHWNIYDYIKAGWRDIAKKYVNKKNAITRKHILYNLIADILRNSVYIIILLLVVKEIYRNPSIGLGTYMLVTSLSGDFQKVATNLFVQAASFFQDIKYMRDFFEMTSFDKLTKDISDEEIKNWDIDVNNVSFKYPGTNRYALKDINIHIKQGEKIAIVGENGSGKTTLINLLCGLQTPDTGDIKFGKVNILDKIKSIRNSISVAFQDFSKYEASIKDNIIISKSKTEMNEEQFRIVCCKTGIDEIAMKQSNGYDELIGIFSEKGNNLSGGQWQKIALARAAYRDNAKIMILDEPTAALDPVAEANLYKKFTDITQDKTTILISHRLGVCSLVDRIIVFKDGRIIGEGTHADLMKKNSYYAEMYKAQAQWYI